MMQGLAKILVGLAFRDPTIPRIAQATPRKSILRFDHSAVQYYAARSPSSKNVTSSLRPSWIQMPVSQRGDHYIALLRQITQPVEKRDKKSKLRSLNTSYNRLKKIAAMIRRKWIRTRHAEFNSNNKNGEPREWVENTHMKRIKTASDVEIQNAERGRHG